MIYILNMLYLFYLIVYDNRTAYPHCKNTHFCNIWFAKAGFFSDKVYKIYMFDNIIDKIGYHNGHVACQICNFATVFNISFLRYDTSMFHPFRMFGFG